eukprot:g1418.t1
MLNSGGCSMKAKDVYQRRQRNGIQLENAPPQLNTRYCPELGVMYELAKGKLPSKRLRFNFPDLFPEESKKENKRTTTFQEPARLVSSESLVRWNVPSIPWRYLVKEDNKPIPVTTVTKDTQTTLTCAASELGQSTGNRCTTTGQDDCKSMNSKELQGKNESHNGVSRGVQTPRHRGVQTDAQTNNETLIVDASNNPFNKNDSSRCDSFIKDTQRDNVCNETSKVKTMDKLSEPVLQSIARKTNGDLINVTKDADRGVRTGRRCQMKGLKARKPASRRKRTIHKIPDFALDLESKENQVHLVSTVCNKDIELESQHEQAQDCVESVNEMEARKLHVQPTVSLSGPKEPTKALVNLQSISPESDPNVVIEVIHTADTQVKESNDFNKTDNLEIKSAANEHCTLDHQRETAMDIKNPSSGTDCIDSKLIESIRESDERGIDIQEDEATNFLMKITPNKNSRDRPLKTNTSINPSSAVHMKKKDRRSKKKSNESSLHVEGISVASSTESLEALERLIEIQHAELVAKGPNPTTNAVVIDNSIITGVLPADEELTSEPSSLIKSNETLHSLLDDAIVSNQSSTSAHGHPCSITEEPAAVHVGSQVVRETPAENPKLRSSQDRHLSDFNVNQSMDLSQESSTQDSYLTQLLQSLSLTESDVGEESMRDSTSIQETETSQVLTGSQNAQNSSSEMADSATAAAVAAITDYHQSHMSSENFIYDVEVIRQ